jgi:hypothetical protein
VSSVLLIVANASGANDVFAVTFNVAGESSCVRRFVERDMRYLKREYCEARKVTLVREREGEHLAVVYSERRDAFVH